MITITELEKLAHLARIKLSAEEIQALVPEFDSILSYIDQLKKVEVSMDKEGRVGPVKNIMRADITKDTSLEDREIILAEAPRREADFIAVKKIIAQD